VACHDDFQRDGAVCVRGAFSPQEVALLARGIERNLAEPSERAHVASRPEDPGRFFEDFCNWQRIPEFGQFIRESPAAAIAGELMGLADELPPGAPMDHELFPVLWP
jgi:ectoine hydroxylase-related dioxygenase (phytanoyl-CoA dioxygenase family)